MIRVLGVLLLCLTIAATGQSVLADNSERLILVTGATGTQGGAVTRALIEKGFPVRAMTRNPDSERAMTLAKLGAEVVQGDFDDIASLDRALEGVYGAFSVQQWRNIGTDSEIRQGSDFADAAKRAGVKHFVYASNGASIEIVEIPHFDSKYTIEAHIRSIGIPYTIIGPRGFMSNVHRDYADSIESGVIEGIMTPDSLMQFIAPRDIGLFAALALESPEAWLGQRVAIAGDEISYAGLAELLSDITGKTISYRQTPWEIVVERTPPESMKGLEWRMTSTYRVDIESLREQYPWMMTLEQYLREQAWLTGR